jgi:hypothetical protein
VEYQRHWLWRQCGEWVCRGNLLDLQVNGTSRARLLNTGALIFTPPDNNPTQGVEFLTTAGAANGHIRNVPNTGVLSIGSTTSVDIAVGSVWLSSDTRLFRDAANTLAQRNGTNAQTSRVYNTYTSATSYERAKLEWSSNVLRIGTEKGSAGGTARDMELQTDGTTRITVKADGAILFSGIPTSNPAVAGQLWNDGGTLKISAG